MALSPAPSTQKSALPLSAIQLGALCWKNILLLWRSRKMLLLLLLSPIALTVILEIMDVAMNAEPDAVVSNEPLATFSDTAPPVCRVFDSDQGAQGYGLPIPGAWCAPIVFAPTTSGFNSLMEHAASKAGWKMLVLGNGTLAVRPACL